MELKGHDFHILVVKNVNQTEKKNMVKFIQTQRSKLHSVSKYFGTLCMYEKKINYYMEFVYLA